MSSKPVAMSLILFLSILSGLTSIERASAQSESGSGTADFEPQMVGDCDPSQEHPLGADQASILTPGRMQIEPSVIFLDETFTLTYRSIDGEGPWGEGSTRIPSWPGFLIENESGPHDLFDDGTNGDAVSGDGVYSRACLHFSEDVLAPGEVATEYMGMAVLNTSLRGTVAFQQASDKVRTTEGGYFVTMGESYGDRWSNGWEHVSPSLCTACYDAWNVSGHVFDYIAIQTRDSVGGAGYVRFHDPVGNIGMDPPCEHNSHCYSPLDGREHPELRGMLHMQSVANWGLTHEVGHGFLGLDSGEFPEEGEGAWNSGDGMHLDSDTTVRGDLSGPFWDPDRGWPYAVHIEDENGDRTEVRLIHDNGSFRIVPDGPERMVWSDIFLYIAGFLPADEATEVNYKLINESIESCVTEEHALFCTGTNVTAERVIEFDTQDFIDMYGARVAPHDGDESQFNVGVLHISDRNHTEAEMVWFTESYKEWAHSTESEPSSWDYTHSDPWPVVTRGLSSVNVDPSQMTERPLADPNLLTPEGGPEPISGCGYPSSQYGVLTAPDSPYGNETLFFSDISMDGLCYLNEFYQRVGEGNATAGPPADASYFVGHFQRTPVENSWHDVTVYQDSEGRLWWENEAGAVWELVWSPQQAPDDTGPVNDGGGFSVEANPNPDDAGMGHFTKYSEVFGLGVYAESGISDAQVIHAATIFAELLDNDEDGLVDDEGLLSVLQGSGAMMPMFDYEGSAAFDDFVSNYEGEGVSAVLFADEVDPSRPGRWGYDASVEEIMHTINHVGHVNVYPEAFGLEPDSSLLSDAMDQARGGQFISHPSSYPEEAWYHYDDTTCDYECMAIEYLYWAQVSNMGILDDPQTCDGISDEWEPCSRDLLESMDVLVYDLITDPQYHLPQTAPDGLYAPFAGPEPDHMAYFFDFAAISGNTHSYVDKSDGHAHLSDGEFIEMALNEMYFSDEIVAFVVKYTDEQQQDAYRISFKWSYETAYDKPESVTGQQLYVLPGDLAPVSSLDNMSGNPGPIGINFTIVPPVTDTEGCDREFGPSMDLVGANLAGCQLENADLSYSDLTNAILVGANLTSANFTGANLYGADLSGTLMSHSNFHQADLSYAYMVGIQGCADALPEGWHCERLPEHRFWADEAYHIDSGHRQDYYERIMEVPYDEREDEFYDIVIEHYGYPGEIPEGSGYDYSAWDGNWGKMQYVYLGPRCSVGNGDTNNVDIQYADLSGMDLSGCIFSGVDFTNTSFGNASLTDTLFIGCTCPDGSTSPNSGPLAHQCYGVNGPEPEPEPLQRDCPQETKLDDVEQISSFEVCAIYVEKVWAIDAIRFVYTDGSYIDAGRQIEDISAPKVVEWLLPENMTISQVDYSIHYLLPWTPHDEVDGIISSVTIHVQWDNGPENTTFTAGAYTFWDYRDNTYDGDSVIATGSFSTTDEESWIYYIEFLNEDCWNCNAVTGVLIHPDPDPPSSPLPGFGTALVLAALAAAAVTRSPGRRST